MENASNALIMAATVLIGVVILSLGVYLFTYMGGYAKSVEDKVRNDQIQQFNTQFLSFKEKNNINMYDVLTLANMAHDYNENNQYTSGMIGYMEVIVDQIRNFETKTKEFLNNFSQNKQKEMEMVYENTQSYDLRKYDCEKIEINDITQKIEKIIITKKQ